MILLSYKHFCNFHNSEDQNGCMSQLPVSGVQDAVETVGFNALLAKDVVVWGGLSDSVLSGKKFL